KRRVELANNLIELLNQKVFDMKLPEKIEIIWNGRFKSTAGKAKWTLFKNTSGEILRQNVSIELSSKVLDSEQKLKNTLAHELCHVATWIIDHQKDEKHGHYFKTWAARVHKAIPDIIVKTKHDYEITYKYNWGCDRKGCSKIYSRHSKSINPDRHGCVCG
ncbi:SprT-like family-domain-containing protein, partial [Phakopsora pachyrhizi]